MKDKTDEIQDKFEDVSRKLEELFRKVKSLELLKLSMSFLEKQSPIFAKNVEILEALDVSGFTSLDGGVNITGSATIGANNILTTASVINLDVYATANANNATVYNYNSVIFNGTKTISGGILFNTNTGKITLPVKGSYLININLNVNPSSRSTDVALFNGNNRITGGRIISASKKSGNASFILKSVSSLNFYITNFSANSFIHNGGSISIVRIKSA